MSTWQDETWAWFDSGDSALPDAELIDQAEVRWTHEPTFAIRRRCSWCGVQLRTWQLNSCRRCAHADTMPCAAGSRWNEAPDLWKRRT